MFGLLDFLMADDYESRKVARFEQGDLMVSTAKVIDSTFLYETAVAHPNYNDGEIVIVDNYDTLSDAKKGHERWVKIMTTEPLPERLKDVSGAGIASLLDLFSDDWRDKPEL